MSQSNHNSLCNVFISFLVGRFLDYKYTLIPQYNTQSHTQNIYINMYVFVHMCVFIYHGSVVYMCNINLFMRKLTHTHIYRQMSYVICRIARVLQSVSVCVGVCLHCLLPGIVFELLQPGKRSVSSYQRLATNRKTCGLYNSSIKNIGK